MMGEAIADRLISEARAEVAASLGLSPEVIDCERGALDEEVREYIDSAGVVPCRGRMGAR